MAAIGQEQAFCKRFMSLGDSTGINSLLAGKLKQRRRLGFSAGL
jgi:hypothetical protein